MDHACYLHKIRASLAPSTGCTEPAAIALNAATARANIAGPVTRVTARLDAYLFKNAMGVGIPGADERGVSLCVALGVTAGDPDAGMNALHTVRADQLAAAKVLRELVTVEIAEEAKGLYIETTITTAEDQVRVITSGGHDNIARIEHAPFTAFTEHAEEAAEAPHEGSLGEFVEFAKACPLEELTFLRDALNMNRVVYYRAMEEGLAHHVLPNMLLQDGSLYAQAKKMAGAASYARMHGIPLPVMTAVAVPGSTLPS